ncbi:unnamed protein product [Eruca vesicaria subsp. sativa]|uniref:Replication protein A 70 kDa DNA-binding subunit B/D first OB fold domain-containing protein n=1 Tax=Eruca vesicaria subsp. sativa TaxID=29727 RepID=A0ABC8K103_ERUVS|nr:unnamed protein product [Eruca vesicaria subsp. sativa]
MANSYTLLTDLKAGRCSNTAEVRLLRLWEARNGSRNSRRSGELMSIDMLFVDENTTMMQATIVAARQRRFRQFLKEGSVYSLTGFDVARSNTKYRLSDAAISIRFNDGTLLAKIESTDRTIPMEIFRFRPYNTILGLGNRGEDLPG